MSAPVFQPSDFAAAYQSLMPRGRVWPRDPDSTQNYFLAALAPTCSRLTLAAANLLVDAFPTTTVQLLPQWEASLGLPDPCAGPGQTIQQRQQQVVAKFTNRGGQSANYFINLLATLGFANCTITNYAPFRAGHSHAGDPVNGPGWFFTWLVTSPELNVVYFRAGQSSAGDPLYSLTNAAVLECTVKEYAPAHTNPLFAVPS